MMRGGKMFALKDFYFYKKSFKNITKEDQESYNKIKEFYYGKSCSPIIYSKNILFLGIESILDVIVFNQLNPTSLIYIYGCDKDLFKDECFSKIVFLNNLEEIYSEGFVFDCVKVTKGFLSTFKNREAFYKVNGNKLYGDYEGINTPPLELYLNIRDKFNLFYLVDEMNKQKISGYLKDKSKSDISIIISGGELNHRLKENILYLRESSKLIIDIVLCLRQSDENIDHKFAADNNIILIENRSDTNSRAWFKGFQVSNSEYVFFMNSEDSFYKDIFDELYLLSITTHSDIAHSGYNIIENGKLRIDNDFTNKENYGIISNPMSLLKAPPTPWGKLYQSTLLHDIGLNTEKLFEDPILHFLTIYSSNIISSLPDKYYQKYSSNDDLDYIQKMNDYRFIYDFVRPYASMEVMNTLLELEIINNYEIGLKTDNNTDELFDKLCLDYGDKYRAQEKISSLRP